MTGIRLNHPLLIGALGGVLAACMACGIGATVVAMLTPSPTPIAVIEPTPSGVPTTTPLPVVPTVTSVPTVQIATAVPTSILARDLTALYLADIERPITMLGNGIIETVQLLRTADNTTQWRSQLRQSTQQMVNAHQLALDIVPPDGWSEFHATLTTTTYECSQAGQLIYSAIIDTSLLQRAINQMERCTDMVRVLTAEMEAKRAEQ